MGCILSKDKFCFNCNKRHKTLKEKHYNCYLAGVFTLEYCKKCDSCKLAYTEAGKREIYEKNGSIYYHCDKCNEHHFNDTTYCYKCNHCYSTYHRHY
jgi:hypothetical protein